ncbi:MAG: hypothetical protein ACK4VI_03140 [Alphaproteobacteria bacterium]
MNIRFKNTMIFFGATFVGFWSIPLCYYSLRLLNIIPEGYLTQESASGADFFSWSVSVLAIWLVCTIFSLAATFSEKPDRFILLLSPAIIPVIYGLAALVLLG